LQPCWFGRFGPGCFETSDAAERGGELCHESPALRCGDGGVLRRAPSGPGVLPNGFTTTIRISRSIWRRWANQRFTCHNQRARVVTKIDARTAPPRTSQSARWLSPASSKRRAARLQGVDRSRAHGAGVQRASQSQILSASWTRGSAAPGASSCAPPLASNILAGVVSRDRGARADRLHRGEPDGTMAAGAGCLRARL
jgi:hypothetical protein